MSEKIIVSVKEGKVRGIKRKSTFSGVDYYSFFAVPYGQPTGGQARFKDPVKVKPWKNILDATTEKEGCSQFSIRLERFSGSEDCLYNNIHTPKLPTESDPLKPVVFMVHPGGFYHGSPETFNYGSPEYVMHRDIVYVCVAYRLHMLGFLNLGLEECSGNQGLKDIILGLKWVRENIHAFGGDPENITLLGSSSGSATVNNILYSPAAKGLFHKAIVMGMYAFNPTLLARSENASVAFEIAQKVGYEGTNENDKKKLLTFLKKSDIEKHILNRHETECNKKAVSLFPCSPFLPMNDQGKNAVLPVPSPKQIEDTARVPLMVGICDKEAAMGFSRLFKKATMENFYTSFRQNYWGWGYNITDEEVKLIKEQVNSFYLKGESIENASLSVLCDIQTDIAYSDIHDTVIDVVAKDLPSSVFVYKFEFEGNLCSIRDRIQPMLEEPLQGTFHADDFGYWACVKNLWGGKTASPTPKSKEMIETFTKLISNFARTGNPNHDEMEVYWRPTNPEHPCYLSINEKLQMVEGKLNGERMEFWDKVKRQFRKN